MSAREAPPPSLDGESAVELLDFARRLAEVHDVAERWRTSEVVKTLVSLTLALGRGRSHRGDCSAMSWCTGRPAPALALGVDR